jgi:serine/threonine-protein kinase RsbW
MSADTSTRPLVATGSSAVTATVPSRMDALPQVRAFVRRAADTARLSGSRTYDLTVAASEACANAIEHSGLPNDQLRLEARVEADQLTVRIDSDGDFRLDRSHAAARRDRGLGLPLMAMLADNLSIRRRPQGGLSVVLTVSTSGRPLRID